MNFIRGDTISIFHKTSVEYNGNGKDPQQKELPT